MVKPMKTVLKSASEPAALEGVLEGARRATGNAGRRSRYCGTRHCGACGRYAKRGEDRRGCAWPNAQQGGLNGRAPRGWLTKRRLNALPTKISKRLWGLSVASHMSDASDAFDLAHAARAMAGIADLRDAVKISLCFRLTRPP